MGERVEYLASETSDWFSTEFQRDVSTMDDPLSDASRNVDLLNKMAFVVGLYFPIITPDENLKQSLLKLLSLYQINIT